MYRWIKETGQVPLFQFTCGDCGGDHELLVRGGEAPACPECASTSMVKHLSAFNMGSASVEAQGCGVSSCCQLRAQPCMN